MGRDELDESVWEERVQGGPHVLPEPLGPRVAAHLLLDDEAVARHELGVRHHEGGHAYARLYHGLGLLEDNVVVRYLEDAELIGIVGVVCVSSSLRCRSWLLTFYRGMRGLKSIHHQI